MTRRTGLIERQPVTRCLGGPSGGPGQGGREDFGPVASTGPRKRMYCEMPDKGGKKATRHMFLRADSAETPHETGSTCVRAGLGQLFKN